METRRLAARRRLPEDNPEGVLARLFGISTFRASTGLAVSLPIGYYAPELFINGSGRVFRCASMGEPIETASPLAPSPRSSTGPAYGMNTPLQNHPRAQDHA